ncbi:MAG: protein-L-isoaspartate(D-aspartate) O-methyltransferase [Magnetococcales bacterium]|nr:protein-L-isoaspartate(D-aspartate) O-methyltransferase [Magnetococcales bacterium]
MAWDAGKPPSGGLDPVETRQARRNMVELQLLARGVRNVGVLEAMSVIPRERFIARELATLAYNDRPLPIEEGQTISQPFMVAVMAEALDLRGDELVLEVGAGSGYSAAILSRLARRVVAVERIPALLATARRTWAALGLDNIEGRVGDGTLGVPDCAPFDAISVTAGAPPTIPPSLAAQLRPGSGRMVIPAGDRELQTLYTVRRRADGSLTREPGGMCRFVPLLGKEGW